MSELSRDQRPINVLGWVSEEADYTATVDAAVEAGLYNEKRMETARAFAGFVLSREEFRKVKDVEGVSDFGVNPPIHAANP